MNAPINAPTGKARLSERAVGSSLGKRTWPPEQELLLCGARTRLDPRHAERLRTLAGQVVDWERVLRLATPHGLRPLLYVNLNAACPDIVPAAVLARLCDHFHANAAHNLFLTNRMVEVLRSFEAHGLRALAYKGPVVAASVYGNLALREFTDLDVIVAPADVLQAKELLLAQGFHPQYRFTPQQEAAFLNNPAGYYYTFDWTSDSGECSLRLELHWRIPTTFALDSLEIWRRLERVSLNGSGVFHFPPEELMWVLCAHGFKHFWRSLKCVCDVAELLARSPGLDWPRLWQLTHRLGCRRLVRLGLRLANELLDAELPDEAAYTAYGDPAVARLAEQTRRELFADQEGTVGVLNNLRVRERAGDKARYLVDMSRYAFTPTAQDWALLPLPDAFGFVHRIVRPVRLCAGYAGSLARGVLRSR